MFFGFEEIFMWGFESFFKEIGKEFQKAVPYKVEG